jgi:hypothetical protein
LELYALSDADKVKMLRKLALFWDGQWFLRSVDKFGLDAAVDLNAAVRTAFGRIEMRTMLKALGKKQADDLRCGEDDRHPLRSASGPGCAGRVRDA